MALPGMYIVAGPPGSGKSRAFPLRDFGVDFFNADDRAAELNGGSYHGISRDLRTQVNREFRDFVEGHIVQRYSLAFETTLRTPITFDQTRRAHSNGFSVKMLYVALEDVKINLGRVAIRAKRGFHSAPAAVLLGIHARSLENLKLAIRECGVSIDELAIYDNSVFDQRPRLVAEIERGKIVYLADPLPRWLQDVLPSNSGL